MALFNSLRPCWAEVDLRQFRRNIETVKKYIQPTTGLIAVVKADAYGHGAVPISRVAVESGCAMLAVAYLEEALELRTAGIKAPILVMGFTAPQAASLAVRYGLTLTCFSDEQAVAINKAAEEAGVEAMVHIKVETGMARLGVRPGDELSELLGTLRGCHSTRVEGAFTHFAAADTDPAYTRQQIREFEKAIEQIRTRGFEPALCHAANSAALMYYPETHLDAVRPGILLYGYGPLPHSQPPGISPIMSWKTRVVQTRALKAGCTVGYGRTYIARADSVIATIPLGYADGYPRLLSDNGNVIVRGRRVPVAGRVCMDQMMVDITEAKDVVPGDEVVVIGTQGAETITADDIAESIGSISYEVLTSVSRRVIRVYLDEQGAFASIRGSDRKIPVQAGA